MQDLGYSLVYRPVCLLHTPGCDVPVTAHRLRHTFASQMLAAGMSILSLQRYLGHADLNTTLIYAEVSDPMLQKDYYRGAATFDPASAELARRVMDLSQRDELRQLIAELKYPELEPRQRKENLGTDGEHPRKIGAGE